MFFHIDNVTDTIIRSSEAVIQSCSVKKVFLEISQNSQENTCARVSFFNKVAGLRLKKQLWHRCFRVNFTKFLRTQFLTEHLITLSWENLNCVELNLEWSLSEVCSFIRAQSILIKFFQSTIIGIAGIVIRNTIKT